MSAEPVFENGTAMGTLNIESDAKNRHPQVVQIYLADTGELIYQSGMIPVGQWVTQGKLLKDLDAGLYPCYVIFNAVDNSGVILGQAATNTNIRVLG